jgi:hypothetical protein
MCRTQYETVTDHLFLIPITANAIPESNSNTPVMPIAGVKLGWRGRGFSGLTARHGQSFGAYDHVQTTHQLDLLTGAQPTRLLALGMK